MTREDLVEQKIRNRDPAWCRAAARTAAVAAVFCVVVAAVLAVTWAESRRLDPATNAEMAALRSRFSEDRSDESLKGEMRSLDLRLRQEHARSVDAFRQGAWLLLAGLAVSFAAGRFAASFRKTLPAPPEGHEPRGEQKAQARLARWSVAGAAVLLVSAGIYGALITAPIPAPEPGPAPDVVGPPKLDPTQQWPRFRGPGGRGVSATANIPTRWNGAINEGILWKTAVPLPGENSPVVWGGRVFLSGATKERREVYCFDAKRGGLLWRAAVENVPGGALKPPTVIKATGYAAPTTATDGERVYAVFANGDLAAFDFNGRPVWARSLGHLDNHYGHASSLATWRNLLIVQADQGRSGDPAPTSALLAFNGATGAIEWRTPRTVPQSWGSPIVIRVEGRDQIVTAADPWATAYNPLTGKEIWRADCLDGEIGPSPIYAAGVVFVAQDAATMTAVRANGAGDVTESHVKWQSEDNLPDTASPLSNGELVFTVAGANLACFDAQDGRLLWEHDFEDTFNSSPSLVGGLVYLMDEEGVMHIFKAARSFQLVATSPLGEKSNTSPAFLDGRIYIRGRKHLFCIGGADGGR